ncbi:hypothetical protein RHMOL_Rhmol12G0171400 [Rhododendron molle]|uniref:Uncharacterized protein n=1 Tax=Rhododendron molle TaxID=49168 RepID=A0ACC0LJF7_RHOML|nr:hypothetical protein RHMOL_Rhmol12G0171400 [Rhododendron molle]
MCMIGRRRHCWACFLRVHGLHRVGEGGMRCVGIFLRQVFSRKRIIVNWCSMCKKDAETVDHLLIHCPVVWKLWTLVLSWFGLKWAISRNVMELLIA